MVVAIAAQFWRAGALRLKFALFTVRMVIRLV
jgi:hypothetical protein